MEEVTFLSVGTVVHQCYISTVKLFVVLLYLYFFKLYMTKHMYLYTSKIKIILTQSDNFKLWPTFYVATNETPVKRLHSLIIFLDKDCMFLKLKRMRKLNDHEFSMLV